MNHAGSLLIVEDERVLSSCLRRHFVALGVEVTIASTVAEGRDCLARGSFDACLLDIGLPDGDGLSLFGNVAADRSIVITAKPDPVRLAAAGVRHVIPKPLDLDVVTRALFDLGLGRGDRMRPQPHRSASFVSDPRITSNDVVGSAASAHDRLGARRARSLRIMLYSHDTVGLGHFRRNLMIARALSNMAPRPNVLMISGATEAVRFPKPDGVDLVTLPALAKLDKARYTSRSLGISLEDLIAIRSQTIRAVASSFEPDVFVVDNVPRGAERELDATLAYLRENSRARIVLGLRDVLDEPSAVARDWARLDNQSAIASYFDAIWVYGDPSVVELGQEYAFPDETRRKMKYVGYLDRRSDARAGGLPVGGRATTTRSRSEASELPYVLCLVGGGEDGGRLAEAFARVSPQRCGRLCRVLLLGPFMPEEARMNIHRHARRDQTLRVVDFTDDPTGLIAGAEAIVSMGGHNSISEILSFEKPALIVPRIAPRREQWIRAHRLASLGVVDVCDPEDLTSEALEDWIEKGPERIRRGAARVDMGGLGRVRDLLHEIAGSDQGNTRGSFA